VKAPRREIYKAGVLKTPLGWCAASWKGRVLRAFVLPKPTASFALRGLKYYGLHDAGQTALPQYFVQPIRAALAGKPFRTPAYDLGSLTVFQRAVLKIASTIPRGQTRSYAWVAQKCGHSKAVRAVGGALHANPLPLFIPCHRVTASNGRLGGFSAGIAMKRFLLKLEASDDF
jgi:O-6-methylguanine DNA methyltransferase